MKRVLLIACIVPIVMFAKVHYAKVEPYDSVVLKSAVSAQVVRADIDAEGRMIVNQEVIHLDDELNRVDLNHSRQTLKLTKEMLTGLKSTYLKQKRYYESVNALSTTSRTQKDAAFYQYIASKNQYLSTKEKELSLELKVAQLEDMIDKKSIVLDNEYLYKLHVRTGDFVNPSSPLATVADLSRAKLVLFLEEEEIKTLDKKRVYINGQESNASIDRVWSVADEKFISSYKAWIIVDNPKIEDFSKLVKIELK
jgi:multidrug resistance efflux pump